jgi:site-specific DNA-methyltransferase (adenine-specific)
VTVQIIQGDCRDVLKTLPDASVDSIITDPPYELGFMGKAWDRSGIAYDPIVWGECLRVLKPGGHLLAFGGSRTYHRLGCAIEDAGFEIRDQIMWLYGSGFPKSRNLHGVWEGWGTALKPAHEPIVVARKPLDGTVAANMQAHGTGALNIDGCRVPVDVSAGASQLRTMSRSQREGGNGWGMSTVTGDTPQVVRAEGRWPANVIHDGSEEVLAAFPDAPGQQANVRGTEPSSIGDENTVAFGKFARIAANPKRGDGGSAARFFYCAKADRADRNVGCDDLAAKPLNWSSGEQSPGTFQSPNTDRSARNHHPTVKPTELMRWLVRLVTPPGGTILDPFAGSGSTGRAADIEGFDAILIELNAEYVAIAERRVRGDVPLLADIA